MSLVLPAHMANAIRSKAAAEAISKSRSHELQSDEFINRTEVARQLQELLDYVDARRADEPDYHLPKPSGWRMTVLMLTLPETSSGGVHIMDDAREMRAVTSPQGVVLALGPACYKDPDRFSHEGEVIPWHAAGDRITWVKYDAAMYRLANGQLIGFMNDTQPVATIDKGWKVS